MLGGNWISSHFSNGLYSLLNDLTLNQMWNERKVLNGTKVETILNSIFNSCCYNVWYVHLLFICKIWKIFESFTEKYLKIPRW